MYMLTDISIVDQAAINA